MLPLRGISRDDIIIKNINMKNTLKIGGKELKSRFFMGTGKFANFEEMQKAIIASKADVVTVAVRRVDLDSKTDNILDFIPKDVVLMPNTSGARNADEAVRIAHLAKAAGCGNWIKIEVIPDNQYLLPDNLETLKAIEALVKEDFVVLPYMNPDLVMARRMVEAGAVAIMPLGAPIGSNRGIKTKEIVKIMVKELSVPVIVDAGIGKPSEAAECMEMGCGAVLADTAVATADDSVLMAEAFAEAIEAGRKAYLAGTGGVQESASASSPLTGFLRDS